MPKPVMALIEHMVEHGSSLTINWGEDTGAYEVAWITGGKRFCGNARTLTRALEQAISLAAEHFGVEISV